MNSQSLCNGGTKCRTKAGQWCFVLTHLGLCDNDHGSGELSDLATTLSCKYFLIIGFSRTKEVVTSIAVSFEALSWLS